MNTQDDPQAHVPCDRCPDCGDTCRISGCGCAWCDACPDARRSTYAEHDFPCGCLIHHVTADGQEYPPTKQAERFDKVHPHWVRYLAYGLKHFGVESPWENPYMLRERPTRYRARLTAQ